MAPAAPISPPTYTRAQLEAFFNHISLPKSRRIYNISSPALSPEETLRYLTLLQKLTLVAVPFENLSIHYSKSHEVDLDADVLWEKVVGRNVKDNDEKRRRGGGRGGYCMENNRFFGVIIYSLGFNVYAAGARVKSPEGFGGWSHMVNLVTINNIKYHVDIGFGGGGPPFPLRLQDPNPETNTRLTAGPQLEFPYLHAESLSASPTSADAADRRHTSIRLIHRTIPDEPSATRISDPAQALWVYEMRTAGSEEWTPRYAFTETEFLPSDFEVMNHYTSTSSKIWFTNKIVCVRYLLKGEDGALSGSKEAGGQNTEQTVDKEIIGQIMLDGNVVKRRIGEESEILEELKTEEDRVEALEKWFGIELSIEERNGIKGMITELEA